jgi:ubiquinone/menaquinone biosynthesis C-methylase UbiE
MTDPHAAFVGSIPIHYDRYLGPLFFHEFADDLAARVSVTSGMRLLETACGTGILTERLLRRLGGNGTLMATDLNEPMLEHARAKGLAGEGLEWRQADATALPFDGASFDGVACQFGLMFVPDKAAAIGEAFRVLRPGGQFAFNVWDAIEHNPVARITRDTIASFFPEDPPQFYTVPFGLHDRARVQAMLESAGFERVEAETVTKEGHSPSADEAALGAIEGNPIAGEIVRRRPEALAAIKDALSRNLAAQLGDRPLQCPLRAPVFRARKGL